MADRDATAGRDGTAADRERSAVVNALVGAAVTVVLTFLPFSSVLGGAVAGYLQGGDAGDGLRVGALSGVIATLPLVLLFAVVGLAVAAGAVASVGFLGVDVGWLLALGGAVVLVGFLFSMVYLVGLSALGGAVGAYVRADVAPDGDGG